MHNFPNSHYITAQTSLPPDAVLECTHFMRHRDCTKTKWDRRDGLLSTDINRCRRTETVLYAPTQRRPSSSAVL